MKVKVYNMKEFIEKNCDNMTTHMDDKMVLIQGAKGFIWTDYEYIHNVKDLITDSVRIYVAPKYENEFSIVATGYATCTLQEIQEECSFEEIESKDFFRYIGTKWRLQNNFRIFCNSLKEIGYEGDFGELEGKR